MPPLLLGLAGDNTHANYAEANRAFYRQTVIPLVRRTAEAIVQWLQPAYGGDRDRSGAGLAFDPDLDAIEALAAEREIALAPRRRPPTSSPPTRSARRWDTDDHLSPAGRGETQSPPPCGEG